MENWWELAQRIYQERGYLVIARISPYRIGAIVLTVNLTDQPGVALPQPFRVMGETTQEDFIAQQELANVPAQRSPGVEHFYRIMTD